MADAPRDRAYDPQRRPNIYYKGDPASDEALIGRVTDAYEKHRWENPDQDRFKEAQSIVQGGRETNWEPMSVEDAQRRAEEGNPISPDATSMAASEERLPMGLSVDEALRQHSLDKSTVDLSELDVRDTKKAHEEAQGQLIEDKGALARSRYELGETLTGKSMKNSK